MTFVVLFILAVVWALYLASWLRSRAQGRGSTNSIASFSEHLSVLERSRPAGVDPVPAVRPARGAPSPAAATSTVAALAGRRDPAAPARIGSSLDAPTRSSTAPASRLGEPPVTLADAQRRRREVLTVLSGATALSLALALALGGIGILLFVVCGAALGGYVFLLARAQKLAREREEKVLYLHQGETDLEPGLLLRQSAN